MTTITNNTRSGRTSGSSALLALFIGVSMAFVMGFAAPNVASAVYYDGTCTGCGGSYSDYDFPSYTYSDYDYPSYTYSDYDYPTYTYSDYDYPSYTYSDYSYNDSYYYTQPYGSYSPQYTYSYNDTSWGYDHTTYYDRPGCVIEASDRRVEEGDFVTITWDSDNANYASLTGFGSVSRSGSERIRITDDETFTLRVEGRGGSDTCSVTVNVDEHRNPPQKNLSCSIELSDRSIEEGDDITLSWDSHGADEAHINQGIGSVSHSGSKRVSPNRDTTYTLTVEDDRGHEEDCSVSVNVEEDDGSDLWCELEASDRSIEEGDRVRLTWDTRGDVRDARINNGVGSVDEDGGSEYVYPRKDTRYTLTVENNDGDEEDCSVTIDVDDGQSPPDVPLVYLSQLPYTGAGDGPLYWMLLIVGSGIMGYALFFRALPFAYARVKSLRSEHPETEAKPVGEGEAAPSNVTRQDVRAFVSALAAGDTASAREFARQGGSALFTETAVILDDVVRARANGSVADPMVKDVTKSWDASKFASLIEAFADGSDEAAEKAFA